MNSLEFAVVFRRREILSILQGFLSLDGKPVKIFHE